MEVPKHVWFGLEVALKNHYDPDRLGRVLIDLMLDGGYSLIEIERVISVINDYLQEEPGNIPNKLY